MSGGCGDGELAGGGVSPVAPAGVLFDVVAACAQAGAVGRAGGAAVLVGVGVVEVADGRAAAGGLADVIPDQEWAA